MKTRFHSLRNKGEHLVIRDGLKYPGKHLGKPKIIFGIYARNNRTCLSLTILAVDSFRLIDISPHRMLV